IAMLDKLPPPPPPTEAALRRVSEQIRRDLELARSPPERSRASARKLFLLVVPILAAWALAVGPAKRRAMDSASWFWSAAILVASIVGIAGLMRLNAAVTGAAVVLSGAFSALMGSGGMLSPAIGVKCIMIELIAASLPLATTAFLVTTGRVAGGPWRFAAVA